MQQEKELSAYLKTFCFLNHGLTPKETRQLPHQYTVSYNVRYPPNWIARTEASKNWFTGFLKRSSTLSIRIPEATSQARAAGFNSIVANQFYDNLLTVRMKYKFLPYHIWNCDETNAPTVLQPPNILATKDLKQVRKIYTCSFIKYKLICHLFVRFLRQYPPNEV